jgi:hypothetical protein
MKAIKSRDLRGKLSKELDTLPDEIINQVIDYIGLLKRRGLKKKPNRRITAKEVRGTGKGIWEIDAQKYVNGLRENDRL